MKSASALVEKKNVCIYYIYISVTALCAYISLIFSKTNNASIEKEQNKAHYIFEGYTVLRHIVPFKCLQFADEKVARSGKNINYIMERKPIAMKKTCKFQSMFLSKKNGFNRAMCLDVNCIFCVFVQVLSKRDMVFG
jgi:hypothetical protein